MLVSILLLLLLLLLFFRGRSCVSLSLLRERNHSSFPRKLFSLDRDVRRLFGDSCGRSGLLLPSKHPRESSREPRAIGRRNRGRSAGQTRITFSVGGGGEKRNDVDLDLALFFCRRRGGQARARPRAREARPGGAHGRSRLETLAAGADGSSNSEGRR